MKTENSYAIQVLNERIKEIEDNPGDLYDEKLKYDLRNAIYILSQ